MIELVKHLSGIGEDVQRISGLVDRACETEADPGVRAHLQSLKALLQHAFGKVQETLPGAEQDLNKAAEEISASTARSQKVIEEVEQRLRERAAPHAALPPAAAAYDPRLGTQLRDDLLKRFGPVMPKAAGPTDAGDVTDLESRDFSVTFRRPTEPPPAIVPQPPAPPPPPRKESEDDWNV